MRLGWRDLGTPRADKAHGRIGGVIGIWPAKHIFGTYKSYVASFARMVDVVEIDHIGLGTDQSGLLGPSTLPSDTALCVRGEP